MPRLLNPFPFSQARTSPARRSRFRTAPSPLPRRASTRRAFTLLELLVALALSLIVALSLVSSLRVAFKASRSAEAAVEPSRTAAITVDLLRQDIEAALPPRGILAGSFVGVTAQDDRGREADDVAFYAPVSGPNHASGDGEIRRVEITVITPPGSNDHVLVRRVTSNLLSPVQLDPDDEVLCRGVGSFTLRYFDGSYWQDTWDSTQLQNTLPTALEITLELDRPDGLGGTRTRRFQQVFPLSCYFADDGSSSAANSSTSGSGSASSGTGSGASR